MGYNKLLVVAILMYLEVWGCHACLENERIALLQLKESIVYQSGFLPSWGMDTHCCNWERIKCNSVSERVIHLNLSRLISCGDRWSLNTSLFLPFEKLKSLDLSHNSLNGWVDNQGLERLAVLRQLKLLDLSGNKFFGGDLLPSLGALSSLTSLSLSDNNQMGRRIDIQELRNLTNMKELNMEGCDIEFFTSSFNGGELMFLGNLERLDLSRNRLNNSTLSSLNGLSSLRYLNLRSNQLGGSLNISGLMSALSNLEELDLSANPITKIETTRSDIGIPSKLRFLKLDGLNGYKGGSNLLESLLAFPNLRTLSLSRNNLKGMKIPQEYYQVNKLEELHLDYSSWDDSFFQSLKALPSLKWLSWRNMRNGTVPTEGWDNLKNLEELYLNDNTIIDDNFLQNVATMSSLKVLWLQSCGLTGTLPSVGGICNLKNLQELDIGDNALSGTLPWCLKNLTSLRQLYMYDNLFTGDLSSSPLSVLTSIQDLNIDNNRFRIPISLEPFFNHSELKSFNGEDNEIYAESGVQNSIPSFQLQSLRLSGHGYGGAFPRFLYHQHDLQSLNLSHVEIRGEFPLWLLHNNTKFEQLFLANTSLSGYLNLPTHPHPSLYHLDISSNHIDGQIPIDFGTYMPKLSFLDISNNRFSGSIPSSLGNLSLHTLKLDGNRFTGTIPSRVSTILQQSLVEFDVSNNSLSGDVPEWVGNMSNLLVLYLSENNFSGCISSWMKNLENLVLLDLSDNNFSGSLPSSFSPSQLNQVYLSKNKLQGSLGDAFRNSTNLFVLDLSHNYFTGRIPKWIGRLGRLSFLFLSFNYFEGQIPIQMCSLHLMLIDLSHNKLFGHIPSCLDCSSSWYSFTILLWNPQCPLEIATKKLLLKFQGTPLQYMSGIDLSSNNFIGHIPSKIGNLSQIKMLNLSHNSFSGPIPMSFSNLKNIESLDLSYNKLEGGIPPQLVNLYSLEVFSVAHNNLSGSTPVRARQFGTFDENSYEDNPFLCGLPLPKICTTTLPPPPTPITSTNNDEEEGFIDMEVFYVSFAASYIIVILAIAVVLSINPYWRRTWFYMIEVMMTDFYYFVVDNCPRLLMSFRRWRT